MGSTFPVGWSTFFLAVSRNKRFVSIDYKTPDGQELIRDLVRSADVFGSDQGRNMLGVANEIRQGRPSCPVAVPAHGSVDADADQPAASGNALYDRIALVPWDVRNSLRIGMGDEQGSRRLLDGIEAGFTETAFGRLATPRARHLSPHEDLRSIRRSGGS